MSKFFNKLVSEAQDDRAGLVTEVLDNVEFTDTGSYSLNALLSGSIHGGIASGKITALAGEESCGKTWFALETVRNFLDKHTDGAGFYFESEEALTKEMIEKRGIDTDRLYRISSPTVQAFRSQALRILNAYLAEPEAERKPLIFVLDSMGNLSTDKELTDIAEGSDKRDMTRAQLLRGCFRALTIKVGQAKIPMIVTSHVYAAVGAYVPTQVVSGGGGLMYAASTIAFLSKTYNKDKDDTKIKTGALIRIKTDKSRFTREQKQITTLLDFNKGLDRYYGLLDIAEAGGVVKKVSTKYQFPDGQSAFESVILKEPERFFTPDVLKQIDEVAGRIFKYGGENNDLLAAG